MTKTVRPLVAGNWKMNGRRASSGEIGDLASRMRDHADLPCDVMICPPAPYLLTVNEARLGSAIQLGAQDCSPLADGAHTGDISAAMLADVACKAVIAGHSERRTDHRETDELVRAKAQAARAAGLTAIICIGETEAERDAGKTLDVLARQLAGSVPEGARAADTVIAYEPVWAIGTGRTPTVDEVAQAHASMREALAGRFAAEGEGMRLLYGGSVKPGNAAELMAVPNVDGALVGGASLKAADFWGIIAAYLD